MRAVTPTPSAASQHLPTTVESATAQVVGVMADGFVDREELARLTASAEAEGVPVAQEFLREFAALIQAKFDAATPEVRGFAARIGRLFTQPDPITRVPAAEVAERVLDKLWAHSGTGGAAALEALKASWGPKTTALEGLVSATRLDPENRGKALVALAERATSAADVQALTGRPMPLEHRRDLLVALTRNKAAPVRDIALAFSGLAAGYGVGWGPTVMRLRAEALNALLDRAEVVTTDVGIREWVTYELRSFWGGDGRELAPLARRLLASGAPLSKVIDGLNATTDQNVGHSPFGASREISEVIAAYAGKASGADADAIARLMPHLRSPEGEDMIFTALAKGPATTEQVVRAMRSGYRQLDKDFAASFAMPLYARQPATAADHLAIHRLIMFSGPENQIASLEAMIAKRLVGKDAVARLIDEVRDRAAAKNLVELLNTTYA
jgi:hypothetical protein